MVSSSLVARQINAIVRAPAPRKRMASEPRPASHPRFDIASHLGGKLPGIGQSMGGKHVALQVKAKRRHC